MSRGTGKRAEGGGHVDSVKPDRVKLNQKAFLAAVAQCGNITRAATLAKINRASHYEWVTDPKYVEAFNAAKEEAVDALELEARRRAMEGVREPVYYLGKRVGYVQKYSDTLLIFLLKGAKPDVYKDRIHNEHSGGLTLEQIIATQGAPTPPGAKP